MITDLPTIQMEGIRLHAITEAQCIARILAELDARRGGIVVTPNLDHWRRLKRDREFAAIYRQADIVVPDGMPLVWASRISGTPLPERVAGSSLISTLSAAAAARGRSVFLLGGAPGTAQSAAEILQSRYPGLKVVGTFCPEPGFEEDTAAMGRIREALQAASPDIIYVGLGSPKQERLASRLRSQLPMAWWLGIGVSFSFLSGHVRRAPHWMQCVGLEWLHRLSGEPRRLARRYLIEGIPFAILVLGGAIEKRMRDRPLL